MTQPFAYRKIAADLQRRIRAQEYPPGTQIPSYSSLARHHQVSVSTVQRAISLLRNRRIVVGQPGRGVFVARADQRHTAPRR